MPNKKINIISVVFYFALLSAPLLGHLLTSTSENKENRKLAPAPQWPDSWAAIESSKSQLEAYLADHFGLRTLFIKWTNKVKYHAFGEVTSSQITIGEAGYIYLNSHNKNTPNSLIKEICGVIKPDLALSNTIKQGINDFIDYYQSQETQVIFAVIPTKSKIYPEYLPTQQKSWCSSIETSWIDVLLNQLNQKNLFYPLHQFKAWKNSFPVYLSKHFHWNGITPNKTAEMIFKQWEIKPEPEHAYQEQKVLSDLSSHLTGLFFEDNSIKYNYQDLEFCHGNQCIDGFVTKYKNGVVKLNTSGLDSGRKLLILSDSFGPHITPHFSRGFDHVYSVDINQLQENEEQAFFSWIISYTQPTHILYLIHDGGMVWQTLRLKRVVTSLKQKNNKSH